MGTIINYTIKQADNASAVAALNNAAAANATAPARLSGLSGVSPEGIILMLQQRMKDVDTQIFATTARLESNTNKAQEISRQLETLYALREQASEGGSTKTIKMDDSAAASLVTVNDVTASAGDTLVNADLIGELSTRTDGDGDVCYHKSDIDDLINKKKQEIQTVNSGNELGMVELQNLMQQRSQVISLGTNLLKTLNETQSNIISNMR